jgi:peptidoglycan-N-acetylglucosamine deacetylase
VTQFQKELAIELHKSGFIVTQDIIPEDSSYEIKSLAGWNDYLFTMAYDQHYQTSEAGPISDQHWIEKISE